MNDLEFIRTVLRRKLNRPVLESLRDGPLRYSQLLHAVSRASPTVVHPKTLTRTLEHLQEQGWVEHHHADDTGMAARRKPGDYRLTAAGSHLADLIAELMRWTEDHRTDDDDDDQ